MGGRLRERDPPQTENPSWTETPSWREIPPGQRPLPPCGQTNASENITFPQLHLRAVIIYNNRQSPTSQTDCMWHVACGAGGSECYQNIFRIDPQYSCE